MSENNYVNYSAAFKAGVSPNSIYGSLLNKAGVQTTPQLARGYLVGSSIEAANKNLSHVCDFKFIFDFSFNLGDLILPSVALAQAIKNAKNAAAAKLRSVLSGLVDKIRAIIDTIVAALGFDATGQFSLQFSLAKNLIRRINEITKKIAQVIEDILVWVFLAQQIQQLLNWIMSLPTEIKQLLENCVTNFTKSIQQVADSVSSIPSQIENKTTATFKTVADDLTKSSANILKNLKDEVSSSQNNLPPVLLECVNNPNDKTANNLISYIQSVTPNSNTIMANTQSQPSPKNTP
jgi:phage-related protein